MNFPLPRKASKMQNESWKRRHSFYRYWKSGGASLQKEKAVGRIFEKKLADFICVLCKYRHAELLLRFSGVSGIYNEQNHILNAVLYYVTPPAKEQLEEIKKFLEQKYGAEDTALELKEDKSLVGGFILRVEDQEFDYSLKGRINALQQKLIWR